MNRPQAQALIAQKLSKALDEAISRVPHDSRVKRRYVEVDNAAGSTWEEDDAPWLTEARAAQKELEAILVPSSSPDQTCATCRHLTPFELAPELNTCLVVNIRIYSESAAIFGCNQWEAK